MNENSSSSGNGSSEPVYVISVAARLAGLPCWVLRVLDQEGIVVPVRTESNRRLYCDNDITLLTRVTYLMKERNVNIDGVKVILEMEREWRQQQDSAPDAVIEPLSPPVANGQSAADGERKPPAAITAGASRIPLPPPHSTTKNT